ncbi:hypothetical protein H2199_000302 [Coniosporium tulheliwenetii]|uniref:Uncharacterized protein n=1 Tax=Coniosporium tulheliwenetii TaxID=3383036 RepID=A0ACC2ZPK6_9PEZI|nr:hypothetical protein H2199_000302 [Cladosporium sp. JES 115]
MSGIEVAGLGLGAVSLTFQVFSGCIKGYQLLSDAKGMPTECQYLRVRLKTEQYRLLDWAHVARLTERDEELLISNASKGMLLQVLDQQEQLLLRFGSIDERCKKLRKPLLSEITNLKEVGVLEQPPAYTSRVSTIVSSGGQGADLDFETRFPQSESLLKKSLAWVESRRKYPAQLRWAVWEKAKVEDLLMKLTAFNDVMKELLTGLQLQQLAVKQTRTEFQIVQLHNKVDQLIELFQSTAVLSGMNNRASAGRLHAFLQLDIVNEPANSALQDTGLQNLATLAQVKAMNSAIDSETLTDDTATDLAVGKSKDEIVSVELRRKDIQLLDEAKDGSLDARVEATYQDPATKRKQQVWIEWKSYDPQSFHGGPDERILRRIKALAALLKWNSHTDRFRALHCLGYFVDRDDDNDDDRCRFGLVFENPEGVFPQTRPRSLLELLKDQTLKMPSLTDRIALARATAECIERLHAVNWLHKGLRSHTILFFADSSGEIDFSKPYVSGFDYSRPVQSEDMTERPPENPAHDLYRHWRVHGLSARDMGGSGYKKSYDIYSLGIILLEIVHWKPIDEILGIDLKKVRPNKVREVRTRLLGEEDFLWYVKANVGNTMQGVVKACLQGPEAFGIKEGADEKDELVGEKLQREFYDRVVMRLESMIL